ncbi:NAD/NADP octopine/nopaline dehydrogenase family protein [Clostridium tagluense]|uniref:NAD/NADP octopine/nopaline dehydrogenase family protein n=1 Tax=Clostridium tagluense TaxID=360422 RepID=UPI001CF0F3D3|nr:NAD/NADP octopine/nopaline dehydrogenase family protein [Clostridium tagluense]MCB2297570.1 NAD/NADP octopine/nopaline dehydrogenase family protein [Clostridium tagluense]
MKITIAGAGNAGSTIAADLSLKGHEVTILKTSKKLHNEHYEAMVENGYKIEFIRKGKSKEAKISLITTDYDSALKNSQLIILYVQTNYQEDVIKKMAPYLDNQVILIEPGYLATMYFLKHCKNKNLTIVEAESSPMDCRITKAGQVTVLFENVRNPIGIYPESKAHETFEMLKALEYNFVKSKSVIEAALNNPNLIVHTIGAFMSIPRIEYANGEYWMYKEVFTKSVWNIVCALDREKIQILNKLKCKGNTYVEECKFRNSLDTSLDATEVFFDYANNHSCKGPFVSNSRYITEDVPEGLVLMESIGKYLEILTPICSSLINMSSAALNRDFRKEGRTLEKLGLENFKSLIENIL